MDFVIISLIDLLLVPLYNIGTNNIVISPIGYMAGIVQGEWENQQPCLFEYHSLC